MAKIKEVKQRLLRESPEKYKRFVSDCEKFLIGDEDTLEDYKVVKKLIGESYEPVLGENKTAQMISSMIISEMNAMAAGGVTGGGKDGWVLRRGTKNEQVERVLERVLETLTKKRSE